jgi:hypothetical protein
MEMCMQPSGSSAFVQPLTCKQEMKKWRFKTSGAVFSSLALAGELICFGDYSGNVYRTE